MAIPEDENILQNDPDLFTVKKHKCPDCNPCQMCNDDKCQLCFSQKTRKAGEGNNVTVELFERQISFLYHLSNDIRVKTGAAVKRAEIIRALIDAIADSGIDLTSAASEAELKTALTEAMKR